MTPEEAPSRPALRQSWVLLGLALLWSGLALAVLLDYHLPEPTGVTSITANGHTYVGNPPALTLLERDPVSFAIITVTLSAGFLVSLVDLILRGRDHTSRLGIGAIVAGSTVLLVSPFGLLPGLLGVGIVGGMLIAPGLPHNQ